VGQLWLVHWHYGHVANLSDSCGADVGSFALFYDDRLTTVSSGTFNPYLSRLLRLDAAIEAGSEVPNTMTPE